MIDENAQPNLTNVVRGKLLDGAGRAVLRDSFKPGNPLSVKFMDELGLAEGAVDGGGPSREFFTMILHELHASGIFGGPVDSRIIVPYESGMVQTTR